MMNYLIKGGRTIDPVDSIDDILDILISDGKIERIGKNLSNKADRIIDAKDKIVCPGFVDMHAHLREPGREDKETILTGTRAAIRGGYTSIACMPNTEPAIDNVKIVRSLKEIIKKGAACNVSIIASITEKRAGKKLTDIKSLKSEGVAGISDDGSSVDDAGILLEALKHTKYYQMALIEHCEDRTISAGGVINQGFTATKMGLRGISREAEYARVERNLELAKRASARIHIAHVSCKETVESIRRAKRDGLEVTAETCPHYFVLTEECCVTYDTNTKMNPPLRTKEDVRAIKEGLSDGAIDAIATDHAPHTDSEKDVEFDFAPFGIIGLETAMSLAVMELIDKNVISWKDLILKMSSNPAKILNLGRGNLKKGSVADIAIIDPFREYIYGKNMIESKSRNSPFVNWKLKAKTIYVFVAGNLAMDNESITG